jgi:hypothetical protein
MKRWLLISLLCLIGCELLCLIGCEIHGKDECGGSPINYRAHELDKFFYRGCPVDEFIR